MFLSEDFSLVSFSKIHSRKTFCVMGAVWFVSLQLDGADWFSLGSLRSALQCHTLHFNNESFLEAMKKIQLGINFTFLINEMLVQSFDYEIKTYFFDSLMTGFDKLYYTITKLDLEQNFIGIPSEKSEKSKNPGDRDEDLKVPKNSE